MKAMQNTNRNMNTRVALVCVVAGVWLLPDYFGPAEAGHYAAPAEAGHYEEQNDTQSQNELVWGGDAEGGSPFVEADPNDPTRVVGFEVEVAGLLAEGLGRVPRFLQAGFTSLDAAAARGDFDVGLSGIEDSPARQSRLAVTIPYYQFREVLTVRDADAATYRTLSDLRGRRVATLGARLRTTFW
jgi:ABC-type amino acid transport substrate-binding protein